MDLGEGGDLFDFIVGCPLGHLPADIVMELLIQIFSVVDYLHSVKGVIHRDLKPEILDLQHIFQKMEKK